jgi:integrase
MASIDKRGRNYFVRFRDEHGVQRTKKAGPDKSVAQRMAREFESRLCAIKAGVIDPREHSWAENERKPLTDHIREWCDDLVARGRAEQYAHESHAKLTRLIEFAKVQRISQLTLSTMTAALGELRSIPGRSGNVGLSDRTVHQHFRMAKIFSRWLWRDHRVREDPLAHLVGPQVINKRTRRPFDPADAATLVSVTRSAPIRWSVTGEERSILYAVALGTGFRAAELRSLTPESFNLDGDPPTITCAAGYTKNGKEAVQPIRPELAELVRPWVAGMAPGQRLFTFRLDNAARMIRDDLAAAGIAESESYDFHCLRHTYITEVVKSGCSVKVAQTLARHSDVNLTMNVYTHMGLFDLTAGLTGLVRTLVTSGVSEGLTGTYAESSISSPGGTQTDPAGPGARSLNSKFLVPPKLTEAMTGCWPNSGSSSACQETLSLPVR